MGERRHRKSMAGKVHSPHRKRDSGIISKFVVNETDTIQAAMLAIDRNCYRSVIVVNDESVVVGTLSDGDVRKSLLDGRLLSTPVHRVMNSDFIALTSSDRARAPAIFAEHHVFLIPVIDKHGKLLDILTAY